MSTRAHNEDRSGGSPACFGSALHGAATANDDVVRVKRTEDDWLRAEALTPAGARLILTDYRQFCRQKQSSGS